MQSPLPDIPRMSVLSILGLEQAIDERSHHRALCHHDEHTDDEQYAQDRQEPKFFALEHECPQLTHYFCHPCCILLLEMPFHMRRLAWVWVFRVSGVFFFFFFLLHDLYFFPFVVC